MGALRFDGVNDVVSISSGMTGNVGTGAYTFRIKSGPAGITLPASGVAGFIGVTGASTSNGFATNSTGQIRVYQAGTNRYGSTGQLIFSGIAFDYTLTHNADGTWNIFNNLTSSPTGESGTFTTSLTWTGGTALNQFGRSSNSNAVHLQGDINTIEVTGLANAQSWQADLSGGTGSILPTASGVNQGSLVNFPTDNSQWIGFGSTYQLSAFGSTYSYSGSSAALTYTTSSIVYTLTANGSSFAYSGSSAELRVNRKVSAQGVNYSYSGASASLTYTSTPGIYRLTALGSLFIYAGGNSSFVYSSSSRNAPDPLALKQEAILEARLANRLRDESVPVTETPEIVRLYNESLSTKQQIILAKDFQID